MNIYLAGDSIVQDYTEEEFIAGWGQSSPFLCVNSSFSYIKYVYAAFIFSNVL